MVFAGGAFALGMLAVRFLRSSGQRQQQTAPSSSKDGFRPAFSGASPVSQRPTAGTTTTSPGGSQSFGTTDAARSAVPTGPGSRPVSQPRPEAPGSTGGPHTAPGSSLGTPAAAPSVTPGSPSQRPAPRPPAAPPGGTSSGTGTAAPGAGAGGQSTSRTSGGTSSSQHTDTGNRTQP
jgi:hypothetical protein